MQINTIELKRSIALKHGIDVKVVNMIVDYPFTFFKRCIRDINNTKALRIPHLGVFYYRRNLASKLAVAAKQVARIRDFDQSMVLSVYLREIEDIEATVTNVSDKIALLQTTDIMLFSQLYSSILRKNRK